MVLSVETQKIEQQSLCEVMPKLLELEHNWTAIGDTAWTSENFEKDLPGKWDMSKYVLVDGKFSGYFIGSVDGSVGKLNKILTDQSVRGKGVGDLLWNEFLNCCKAKGLEKAEFKVLTDNEHAIRFYRKHGCLFNGEESFGTDGKMRYVVKYPLSFKNRISHSRPSISAEDIDAVANALVNGDIATGRVVNDFESAFSKYIGRDFAISTSSGTAALHLALRSLNISEGDEVILPSYVCGSVMNTVAYCRATPVLADINTDDYNISYEDVKSKVSEKTKALILPHMFGKPIRDLDLFLGLNIPVVEDCALSLGSEFKGKKVGSFGDVSIFSFYAIKMMASGFGGMVLADNPGVVERLNSLVKYDNRSEFGESYNYKMSDMHAALGLSQLGRLGSFVERRRSIAQKYSRFFEDAKVDFSFPKIDGSNIFFRYIIGHLDRDSLIENVNKRGVGISRPVFRPLHSYLNLPDHYFPNASAAYERAVSIPIYPSLSDVDVENVAGALINWKHEMLR